MAAIAVGLTEDAQVNDPHRSVVALIRGHTCIAPIDESSGKRILLKYSHYSNGIFVYPAGTTVVAGTSLGSQLVNSTRQ